MMERVVDVERLYCHLAFAGPLAQQLDIFVGTRDRYRVWRIDRRNFQVLKIERPDQLRGCLLTELDGGHRAFTRQHVLVERALGDDRDGVFEA